MSLTLLETLVVCLGLLCVGWGALALRYPRYSYIAAKDRKPSIQDEEESLEMEDPIRWRGWRREKESFTTRAQRRAGAMVMVAGAILLWIGIA
jgi:hypothetical protein